MKLSTKTRARLWTVMFMFLVTLVSMSAVSALSLATRERVRLNASLFLRRAVLEAAGLPVPLDPLAVQAAYDAAVTAVTNGPGPDYYRVAPPAAGDIPRYVFVRSGSGLWGTITAVLGVKSDFSSLTGIAFTQQNETPGLGARIDEDWFKAQFKGKRGPFQAMPEGTKSLSATEFDGITGATITTLAVRDIVNSVVTNGPNWVVQPAG